MNIFPKFYRSYQNVGSSPVADSENFGGGDLKHKTSKIRMSSPKLRVIFRPKSEIQTFFSLKFRWSPKKKKRSSPKLRVIFRPKSEIQTFFSPKFSWSPKKKKKKKRSSPKSPTLNPPLVFARGSCASNGCLCPSILSWFNFHKPIQIQVRRKNDLLFSQITFKLESVFLNNQSKEMRLSLQISRWMGHIILICFTFSYTYCNIWSFTEK